MYEAFFGLRNRPFSPLPRVDTFIPLAPLREPLDTLIRCIDQQQGIGVVTAPAGTGKSLICRLLHHHFRDFRKTVLITTARFPTRRALLQAILFELKHPYVGLSEQEARLRIFDLLQASSSPMNRMLLIVDEAHLLSPRGLEELRTLTDYEIDGKSCFSLVLSGQLELEEMLTDPAMNALNQRVGCHVCIEPLTYEESTQYIRERLRLAGNDGLTIFTPEAVQLICSASEGNPRRINQLCDHSLLLAFAEEERPVNEAMVRSALLDLRELPLHWNAPLDLANQPDRNPLETFAEEHAAFAETLSDDLLHESDTEIDLEEDSAFESECMTDFHGSSSAVFEIGAPTDESPIDQLFQVDKFIVPNEYQRATEMHAIESVGEAPTATESHAYETPLSDVDMAFEDHSQVTEILGDEISGLGFHLVDELAHSPAPLTASTTPTTVQTMGFEEIVVDDVYAEIDRLGEWSAAIPQTVVDRLRFVTSVVRDAAASTEEAPQPALIHNNMEVASDDLDDSLLDEQLRVSMSDLHEVFEVRIDEPQPVLFESQLLDFINEISVDVRQFRQEQNRSSGKDEDQGSFGVQLDTVRPHHQSLRQSLNWQYDVVEPQSAQAELVTDVQDSTVSVKTCEVREKSVDPTPVPQEKVSRPAAEDTHPDRRYAQLFTRLQRQRRRVELVMNQERRSGTEARTH